MKTIAVTIGIGPLHAGLATLTSRRMAKGTGVEGRVLSAAPPWMRFPHHLKFRLFELFPDADRILYHDADLFLQENIAEEIARLDDRLAVTRDLAHKDIIQADAEFAGCPVEEYFNSGLMLLTRSRHAEMLRCAESFARRYRCPRFIDQTYLNVARLKLGVETTFLDARFNRHCQPFQIGQMDMAGIAGLHVHGIRDLEEARNIDALLRQPG